MTLVLGLAVPLGGEAFVGGNALAQLVTDAKLELRIGISQFCRLFEASRR